MNVKPIDTHVEPNAKLIPERGELLLDAERYNRLIRKLNYHTITHPDISFTVSVVSQFFNSPCEGH